MFIFPKLCIAKFLWSLVWIISYILHDVYPSSNIWYKLTKINKFVEQKYFFILILLSELTTNAEVDVFLIFGILLVPYFGQKSVVLEPLDF